MQMMAHLMMVDFLVPSISSKLTKDDPLVADMYLFQHHHRRFNIQTTNTITSCSGEL
jgi:hypothetical protein